MLAIAFACLTATAPEAVIDPRPQHHVVDLSRTLGGHHIDALDAAAKRAARNGELMVVVVQSTDGRDPRSWTTSVFNLLGLDAKERNRGVLLMAALQDRKAEIVIGDGFADSTTQETDRIMRDVIVAHMKRGDPAGALVAGAEAITDRVILAGAPAEAVLEPLAEVDLDLEEALKNKVLRSVINPMRQHGITDGAKIITAADKKEIQAARALWVRGEMAVVTTASTGGLTPALFGRALMKRFELGEHGALLLVVSGKEPELEIVLGGGWPREAASQTVSSIGAAWARNVLSAPRDKGAATAIAARSLTKLPIEVAQWQAAEEEKHSAAREVQRMMDERNAANAAAQLAREQEYASRSDFSDALPWGGGIAGLLGGGLGLREILRRRPRKCRVCNIKMERLGEEVDDAHLTEGEKTEERLGSVDYDIWCCGQCGEILKTRWGAIFSRYSTCRGCSFRAMSSTSCTIRHATTSSSGLAEVTERCSHCSHVRTYTKTIPRKTQSSSSSGSRSSGGSSRGSSSGRGSSGSW